jgi:hypothetical protein
MLKVLNKFVKTTCALGCYLILSVGQLSPTVNMGSTSPEDVGVVCSTICSKS